MALENIHAMNNYNMYPAVKPAKEVGPHGGASVNPFGESYKPTAVGAAARGENNLDPKMLADKKANFEVGLGGTNNPDNHKLFAVA